MNCNPCCGCCPPITTYNPSVADSFPTILQQVEYLKALLKKYPSQQWFITQEKVTEETVKLDSTKIPLRGRAVAVGDFILGNTVDGTILIFQYTGAMTELTYYVVEYVGIYTNQDVAEEALVKAQNALDLAQTNEKDIGILDGQVAALQNEASIEITLEPATATSGTLTDEQYTTLNLNDNCYIKLNEVVYTLSKNSATGVLIYSSKYLSDSKTTRTITVTKSTKAWVMTEVSVGGGKLYLNDFVIKYNTGSERRYIHCFMISSTSLSSNTLSYEVFDRYYDKFLICFGSDESSGLLSGAGTKSLYLALFYHLSSSLNIMPIAGASTDLPQTITSVGDSAFNRWDDNWSGHRIITYKL